MRCIALACCFSLVASTCFFAAAVVPETRCTHARITGWRGFAYDACMADIAYLDASGRESESYVLLPCSTDVDSRQVYVRYVQGHPDRTRVVPVNDTCDTTYHPVLLAGSVFVFLSFVCVVMDRRCKT